MTGAVVQVDCTRGALIFEGRHIRCAIGRGGAVPASAKREGDGATPLGRYPIRAVLLRPDRGFAPLTGLPWRWIRPSDGWSDDIADPAYNRPVSHPHRFSAELMWRDDAVYDVVIVMGHNDDPVVPGLGSAIFWHLANEDYKPTEGCVAIARPDMERLLPRLSAGDSVEIVIGEPFEA